MVSEVFRRYVLAIFQCIWSSSSCVDHHARASLDSWLLDRALSSTVQPGRLFARAQDHQTSFLCVVGTPHPSCLGVPHSAGPGHALPSDHAVAFAWARSANAMHSVCHLLKHMCPACRPCQLMGCHQAPAAHLAAAAAAEAHSTLGWEAVRHTHPAKHRHKQHLWQHCCSQWWQFRQQHKQQRIQHQYQAAAWSQGRASGSRQCG